VAYIVGHLISLSLGTLLAQSSNNASVIQLEHVCWISQIKQLKEVQAYIYETL